MIAFCLALFVEASVSYKLKEAESFYYNDDNVRYASSDLPMVATQFAIGFEARNGVSFGVLHDSTPQGGYPLNPDLPEYWRHEVFLRYKLGGY